MVTQYKPGPQALNHMSKTRRNPRREQPPPDPLRSTSRYCNLATELRARGPEHWAVVLGSWTLTHVPQHMNHAPRVTLPSTQGRRRTARLPPIENKAVPLTFVYNPPQLGIDRFDAL